MQLQWLRTTALIMCGSCRHVFAWCTYSSGGLLPQHVIASSRADLNSVVQQGRCLPDLIM
jgi:hypothetical protein